MTIEQLIDRVIEREGGFVAHTNDKWGRLDADLPSGGNGVFVPVPDTRMEGRVGDTFQSRVLLERHAPFRCNDDVVGPRVVALHSRRSPSAVSRLVVAVDVDAVEGRPVRALPHVCQKCREVVAPLVAHRDAATAVGGELVVSGIKAPRLRAQPAPVLGSACASHRGAMLQASRTYLVRSQTSARFGAPTAKDLGQLSDDTSAIASARPCRPATNVPSARDNYEAAEPMAGQVNAPRNGVSSLPLLQVGGRSAALGCGVGHISIIPTLVCLQ